jgi:CRP/FNR family transcriptional regulator, cyclic AMP receptor protein
LQERPSSKNREKEVMGYLKQVPVLQGLEDKSLESLRRDAEEETYSSGKVIVKEGSLLSDLYIILRGRVEVRRKGASIAKLGRGQFFGEMAFLNEEPTGRSADIVAMEETDCLRIKGPAWYSFLRKNPDVAIEVIRTLTSRLRSTDWALSDHLQNLPPAKPS